MTEQASDGSLGPRLSRPEGRIAGIVIRNRPGGEEGGPAPRIAAFIWGGKVRPTPTLPYGRWKGAA